MKLSIIIPVYNVESYLCKCLDSIICQYNNKIEIILVDDGSTDNSPIICNEYANLYSYIKVVHKENGGLSDARNVGMNLAGGKYIMFVDSDDYLENNSLEKIDYYLSIYEPDILVGDAHVINGKKDIIHSGFAKDIIVSGSQYLQNELMAGSMNMAVWLNIYNSEFLKKNNLNFKLGILHEDEEFTPRAFLLAEKVVYSGCMFYHYVLRDNSITNKQDQVKNAIDLFNTCYQLEKIYEKVKEPYLRALLRDSLSYKYLDRFQRSKFYKKKYQKYINKQFVLRNAYFKKTKLKALLFYFNTKLYYFINKLVKNFSKTL